MDTKNINYPHTKPILVDLGLPSGTLWADRNVGADTPEGYGDYYRWRDTVPYDADAEARKIVFTDLKHDTAYAILGEEYRMPTEEQMRELYAQCKCEKTTLNRVNGIKVTGPNGNHIFLPAAGDKHDIYAAEPGHEGFYWSSTDENYLAYVLDFRHWGRCTIHKEYAYGCSVRAVSATK